MKNSIAHVTRRISIVAGLIAAFALAPALSSVQTADAAPRHHKAAKQAKRQQHFQRKQVKRVQRFQRKQAKRQTRFIRRNRPPQRVVNNRWNNRRYHTKYRTIYRQGRPQRQYYRVFY